MHLPERGSYHSKRSTLRYDVDERMDRNAGTEL